MSDAEKKGWASVAVVDDDEESTQIMQEFLESNGFSAERFLEAEAFLAAKPCRFDAVLLDINFPGMWGSECVFTLRHLGYAGPVIGISGNLESWDADDLRALGFTCTLGKPLNPVQLIELLVKYVMRRDPDSPT